MKRLITGQPLPLEEIEFTIPPSRKKFTPLRATPLPEGERRVVMQFPGEVLGLPLPMQSVADAAVVRPSPSNVSGFDPCLECVVKHLGEADSLIREIADGYDNLIEITGAFRAAELHAERWPQLRAAVREARKRWWESRFTPDWKALNGMVGELIKAGGGA
jgi:hypothetical protein